MHRDYCFKGLKLVVDLELYKLVIEIEALSPY